MSLLVHFKTLAASAFLLLTTGCTQNTPTSIDSENTASSELPLQLNANVEGITLSGIFTSQGWRLELATPLLISHQEVPKNRYSIRINDHPEEFPVSVTEVSKGPLHFSVAVVQKRLPIHKLTLWDNVTQTQLESIENEQPLPSESEWMSQVRLTLGGQQLCLTWPDQLFTQVDLLRVIGKESLHLHKQSFESPLCIDYELAEQAKWRVNLRNPLFAVQLATTT